MKNENFYQEMAKILEYPEENYADHVAFCSRSISIDRFSDFIKHADRAALEELYVGTFDVQSICCLDVGYVMFGEDYRRGQFMAQLKMLANDRGVDLGSELPDFLPNVLRLMTQLKRHESQDLVAKIVAPALDKMLEGFAQDGNIYREPLAGLRNYLKEDFGS